MKLGICIFLVFALNAVGGLKCWEGRKYKASMTDTEFTTCVKYYGRYYDEVWYGGENTTVANGTKTDCRLHVDKRAGIFHKSCSCNTGDSCNKLIWQEIERGEAPEDLYGNLTSTM
ncbi:unnamed protein product [Caenorhabditis nigoni]|uniref:Uncharacterized protein n=1 Tax=Caenorhabditis nigoni TaxID=1611254 RepID=A0A2G5SSH1_9PELO|nr:hypothetical protein B9Z55_024089 [Caenorhabditis nigoni]